MEQEIKRYLVTSALPYANGPLHIGHLAGVYIPADIYVRYLRARGRDVLWVCGSDEHGVPVTIRARQEGVSPQAVVDKYHAQIEQAFADFGMSFDIYHRTTDPLHYETASAFFRQLYDGGKFVERESEQYYDVEAAQFLADRYIVGTCPRCGDEHAYGDQCEACGSSLNATDLINPRSMLSGGPLELRRTRHWFLPLEEYESFLREWILEGHTEWKVNVYGQCKSWLDGGLHPRAVSRDLSWGVPVPVEGAKGKVLYVWFDAPIGYISATKALRPDDWETYWKDPHTKMVHFIGKDNIVFHCIVFPCMLRAHGGYILPENVPANEFLNLEGEKISTSRNWAVWLHEYLEDFPGKQDVLRYVLAANMPETKDNDFTWRDFQQRNNAELVGVLGNFFHRVMILTAKYHGGLAPSGERVSATDRELLARVRTARDEISAHLESFHFREALKSYLEIARLGNKYLADEEPWKLIKTDEARVSGIMYTSLQLAAALAYLGEPFLPHTAPRMRAMLNLSPRLWDEVEGELIAPGHRLGEAELLFEPITDDQVEAQLARLRATVTRPLAPEARPAPQKETVNFEQFEALDLRVGQVLECERVPKTKKLLKLLVDTGLDHRTIVSGIAEYFSPEEMVGQRVMVCLNLEPRRIRGVESHGMLLFAERPDGGLVLMQPAADVPNGARVG